MMFLGIIKGFIYWFGMLELVCVCFAAGTEMDYHSSKEDKERFKDVPRGESVKDVMIQLILGYAIFGLIKGTIVSIITYIL